MYITIIIIIIIINKVLISDAYFAGALYIFICGWNAVQVQGWELKQRCL